MTVSEYFQESTLTGVKVYLPVRQYEVTLKHRLLEQLGGFSRIILEALHDFAQAGRELIYSITGLTQQQLEPVTRRLEGLELIRGAALTAKGKEMVLIYNHLHRQSRLVWLDGRYSHQERGPSFFGDLSLPITPIDAGQAFVLKSWGDGIWPKSDWNEDRAFQLKRLIDQPIEYLPSLFEGFAHCMAGSEARMNIADWEVEVRIIPEFATARFAVEAAIDSASILSDSHSDTPTHFNFSSPVIGIRTAYSTPKNAPVGLATNTPKDRFKLLGLLNTTINTASISREATSDWIWPELGTVAHEQVLHTLFHNLREEATSLEPLFNRDHQVETWWQPMSFSWESVDGALRVAGLKRVKNPRERK
ncbi:MAG: hypothetical protein ACOH2T_18820 [Pseudomonas sp.]